MKSKNAIIVWEDSVLSIPERSHSGPVHMETRGSIIKEEDDFLIVKNKDTKQQSTGRQFPYHKKPNFFFIPKGMIKKIEYKDKNE